MAPPDLRAGGHRFDFVSGICQRCKISRKQFDEGGQPRCKVERPDGDDYSPMGTV
jgi:hypothetical protein